MARPKATPHEKPSGGKGANLAEMSGIGIPVPAGFTITTEVCAAYYANQRKFPAGLRTGRWRPPCPCGKTHEAGFGDPANPLLVSVRSGARLHAGMMDTVLNIGLNDQTVKGLIDQTGNPRFAMDAYRRFVSMYGDVVMESRAGTRKKTHSKPSSRPAKNRKASSWISSWIPKTWLGCQRVQGHDQSSAPREKIPRKA
jgi:pyruvate,orthophosphate dikinase